MIEGSHWIQYKPISSLSDDAPIEFVVPANSEEYLDLAHSMISLRVTLKTNVAEENMTADVKKNLTNVGCINNLMNSLFSQIDCFKTSVTAKQFVSLQIVYRNYSQLRSRGEKLPLDECIVV